MCHLWRHLKPCRMGPWAASSIGWQPCKQEGAWNINGLRGFFQSKPFYELNHFFLVLLEDKSYFFCPSVFKSFWKLPQSLEDYHERTRNNICQFLQQSWVHPFHKWCIHGLRYSYLICLSTSWQHLLTLSICSRLSFLFPGFWIPEDQELLVKDKIKLLSTLDFFRSCTSKTTDHRCEPTSPHNQSSFSQCYMCFLKFFLFFCYICISYCSWHPLPDTTPGGIWLS